VRRKIALHGWDHLESDTALHQAKEPFYQFSEKIQELKYTGQEFDQLFKEAIENCPADPEQKAGLFNSLKQIHESAPHMKEVLSFVLARKIERIHQDKGELANVYRDTFAPRQAKLIENCQRYSTANNRVFVIAGAAHVLLNQENEPYYNEGVETFYSYLDTTKFTVFDNDRSATETLKKEFEPLSFRIAQTVRKILNLALTAIGGLAVIALFIGIGCCFYSVIKNDPNFVLFPSRFPSAAH
jgi:DNA repair exonuclease SbcCD ATPase subunit